MDFNQITYAAFATRIAWINQQLAFPKPAQALLAVARRDLPIIEPLLSAMNALSEASQNERLLAKAQRDVEVFLAIWHVLHQPKIANDESGSRQRGHIYGYDFPRFLVCQSSPPQSR